MTFGPDEYAAVLDKVVSHAMATGLFDSVNTHEPKSPPGNGVSCSMWMQTIKPMRSSGQASTSVNLILNIRIYTPMMQEPQDDIDKVIAAAALTLMAAYSGDFDLGITVRGIDLLGMDGTPMAAQAGYMEIGGTYYRTTVITLPILINDAFTQAG